MIFILCWLAFPLIWYFLLLSSNLKVDRVGICSLVFWGIIIYQYLGLPILFFGLDRFRVTDVNNEKIIFDVFFYTS
ncbi:MAG: hypothetical protein ACK52X_07060, partial [bacterium]